jgi:hypothetical protein
MGNIRPDGVEGYAKVHRPRMDYQKPICKDKSGKISGKIG